MKSFLALLVFPALLSANAMAAEPAVANPEGATVVKVVQQFFDAMQARDAEGISKTWLPKSQYSLGVPGKDGYAMAQKTIEGLTAELMQGADPWLERMWSPTVHVEGRIAVVWARYDFHVGKKFTHNGTDCYTLLKTDDGWKIAGLVFTIEPGARTENPAGPPH